MNSPATLPGGYRRTGILFVVSAPSGAGKTTLHNSLKQTPDFAYSVSCTTRAPRAGEIDGEHYHFLTPTEFEKRISAGDFLEFATVHGDYYGTLRENVATRLRDGVDVLIDVDIQGAGQIRESADPFIRDALADVFLMPPSLAELERRLVKRGTETPAQLATRLRNASSEIENWRNYRYTIISASIEEDLQRFRAIMSAERSRSSRLLSPATP